MARPQLMQTLNPAVGNVVEGCKTSPSLPYASRKKSPPTKNARNTPKTPKIRLDVRAVMYRPRSICFSAVQDHHANPMPTAVNMPKGKTNGNQIAFVQGT